MANEPHKGVKIDRDAYKRLNALAGVYDKDKTIMLRQIISQLNASLDLGKWDMHDYKCGYHNAIPINISLEEYEKIFEIAKRNGVSKSCVVNFSIWAYPNTETDKNLAEAM